MSRFPVPRRHALAALVTSAAALAAAPSAQARTSFITSFDGTRIVYNFYPAPGLAKGATAPTVMNGPGYSSGGAKDTDKTPAAMLKDGYNVLTWDPRGFGGSGGNVETDSPDFEGRDAQALIDLIAKQPEARLEQPGDPLLGMIGGSYGGGIQNVLAAIDPRVDVITPSISWHSLVTSLDKANTAKGGWGSLLFGVGVNGSTTGGLNGPAGPMFGRMQDPATTRALADGAATGEFDPSDRAYFESRGPGEALIAKIKVPTLITQATNDTLFTLQEAIRNHAVAKRTGVPLAMTWFCGGLSDPSTAHGVCLTKLGPQPNIVLEQSQLWLKRYLKGDTSVDTGPGFRWVSDTGALHYARDYPVPTGSPVVGEGGGTLAIAAGDTSGAVVAAQKAANALSVALAKPKAGTQLLGEPRLSMTYSGTAASPNGRIYAQLVDDASGVVLGNQVTPVPVTFDGKEHTTSLPLEAVAVDAIPGSSYTLQLIGGSDVYFGARQPALVTVSKAAVSIPTVAEGASSTNPAEMRAVPTASAPTQTKAACKASVVTLRLHARKGTRIVKAKLYVDGRLRRTARGKHLTKLRVGGLGGAQHSVRVDTFTKRGLAVRSVRRVDACGRASGVKSRRFDR